MKSIVEEIAAMSKTSAAAYILTYDLCGSERRRRTDEQPQPERVPPHERCILFNCGPESAEWGPPAYMADGFQT